jgi:hypothetical protein
MMAMVNIALLAFVTMLATGVAVLMSWLTLRAGFYLMQPARRAPAMAPREQGELVRGTVQLVRAFGVQR